MVAQMEQVWRRARQTAQRTATRWQVAGRSQAWRAAGSQWLRTRLFGGGRAVGNTGALSPVGSPVSRGVSDATSMFSPLRQSFGGALL